MPSKKSVAIVGAGPAGLMAAEVLSEADDIRVDVYDAMPTAGRKFLMAGKGGLNITHAEPFEQFLSRYGQRRTELEPMLRDFSPAALRAWVKGLGVDTFTGSSGRVFPTEMKAAPLLRAWLHRLRIRGVRFHMRHRWLGWHEHGWRFDTPVGECVVDADALVLALGGGSWPQLGSTGAWQALLNERGIDVEPLRPANCGFDVAWSDYFKERFAGHPVKPVCISFADRQGQASRLQGELMISEYGLEGGLIYALSAALRDEIEATGFAQITVDLLPNQSITDVFDRLSKPRGKNSLSNFLRKALHIDGVKAALLREALLPCEKNDMHKLAETLKELPLTLLAARPLEEAISSAGGVRFAALDDQLMLRKYPGVFCAGEMLDWEAPTGGYLLTACLASGRSAGCSVLTWLQR
ncbi:MAG: TIGR03862 family flavoprotein [Gammaproteobacteria bacterium]